MPSQSRVTPDRTVLVGLLLTAAIYLQDLRYDFVIDDVQLDLLNQTGLSWHNLKMIFTKDIFFVEGPRVPDVMAALHYRPIFTLWMMINQTLFSSVIPWWHLTSLLLHLCVVFLVYKLGVKLLKDSWAAALAALLFAFHPIHVESVSYVSASTDLLVTLFLIVSFLCYSRFREENASPGYLAIAVLAAALAMLSKETAAMYPWLLVVYEALRETPAGTTRRWKQLAWTLPFFAVVGIYSLARLLLLGRTVGTAPGSVRVDAFLDSPLVFLAYLRNMLWSVRLSFFYPTEWASQWTLLKGFEIGLVLLAAILIWNHFSERPLVRMQLPWAAILFIPPIVATSTFLKEDWVHDRHMYLVSVPLCLLAAALLADQKIPRNVSIAAGSAILAVLLVETAVQVPRFTDGITLFESALKVAPSNAIAHRDYAFALNSYGRYDESFREYRIAAEMRPRDAAAHGSFGEALAEVGRDEDAAAEYEKALRLSPKPTPYRAFLLYRIAAIKVKYSHPVEGEAYLREAIQIAPDAPSYRAILAEALRQQGRAQEASEQMLLEASEQKNVPRAPAAAQK
ncbi:MAG TPA: tetratricopeptide repeat protein [Candidatus Acidoferrales bacterium]|nr:tetratricopeptide repeat protein [Candidatus Acidoferrales bacterium]